MNRFRDTALMLSEKMRRSSSFLLVLVQRRTARDIQPSFVPGKSLMYKTLVNRLFVDRRNPASVAMVQICLRTVIRNLDVI